MCVLPAGTKRVARGDTAVPSPPVSSSNGMSFVYVFLLLIFNAAFLAGRRNSSSTTATSAVSSKCASFSLRFCFPVLLCSRKRVLNPAVEHAISYVLGSSCLAGDMIPLPFSLTTNSASFVLLSPVFQFRLPSAGTNKTKSPPPPPSSPPSASLFPMRFCCGFCVLYFFCAGAPFQPPPPPVGRLQLPL